MKLIDRLRAADRLEMPTHITPDFERSWATHAKKILDMIKTGDMPIIVIDNVAEYYYYGTDQENWDLRNDFPNLAPPYEVFWIEHKIVQRIRSEKTGEHDFSALGMKDPRTGFLMFAVPPAQCKVAPGSGEISEEVAWVYVVEMFNYYGVNGDEVQGPTGTYILQVDKDGRIVSVPQMQGYASQESLDGDPLGKYVLEQSTMWMHPSLLAISFLHCRNVQVIENETPPKLAKRTMERHGYKPVPWKTLVIEPLKEILRREGGVGKGGNSLQRGLHICRGHFKDYRQGKGLFGKYHQMVWHPQTVRGSKREGEERPPQREIEVKVS